MKKIITIIILAAFLLPVIFAEQQSIGYVKQNSCIDLRQECPSCSYVNLTSVTDASKRVTIFNGAMASNGTSYTYEFCNTSQIGDYAYCTLGDIDGTDTVACIHFEVTPSGFTGTLGFYFILLAVIAGLIILGFAAQEYWFLVMAGMGLIMLGIYSINNGVAGFKDMFMTWGIGLFEIGVGAVLSIGSAWYKFEQD